MPAGSMLVGYDGSPGADAALRWALREAAVRKMDITVMQSWHEPIMSELTWRERWEDPAAEEHTASTALAQTIDQARAGHPDVVCNPVLVRERPAEALVEAAVGHDLVVVGSRGHGGFAALTLGSVAEHVAGASPVTVVVVGSEGSDAGDIVVGVDGSIGSRRALLWAAEEGRARSASVRAVLAWTARIPVAAHGAQPFGAAATDDDASLALHRTVVEELGAEIGDSIARDAVCAPAAKALIEAADGAALLALGASPASDGAHHRLGSVARQVLRHAPCPVAVVR